MGCKINYYLTQERYEVDFLVQLAGRKKLIQVVWDAEDEDTLAREERSLNAAMEELEVEGEILTLNSYLQNGLKV